MTTVEILSSIVNGERITILYKNDIRHCIVLANMPSLKKMQVSYKIINKWKDVWTYKDIENGFEDLNKHLCIQIKESKDRGLDRVGNTAPDDIINK